MSRRALLAMAASGATMAIVAACGANASSDHSETDVSRRDNRVDGARLTARPHAPTNSAAAEPPGTHPLGVGDVRDGLLYVPTSYRADRPAPLVLMLHGAGGSGRGALRPLFPLADAAGLILLAPDSRGGSWDAIRDGFGVDVQFIDRALATLFDRYSIDASRITIEGFSDGATYALSLGIANGDLFSRIVAFSPGFIVPARRTGRPRIFESHGTADEILPIDRCSRVIVPALKAGGYDVRYREFDGPHTVPADIAKGAVAWMEEKE